MCMQVIVNSIARFVSIHPHRRRRLWIKWMEHVVSLPDSTHNCPPLVTVADRHTLIEERFLPPLCRCKVPIGVETVIDVRFYSQWLRHLTLHYGRPCLLFARRRSRYVMHTYCIQAVLTLCTPQQRWRKGKAGA